MKLEKKQTGVPKKIRKKFDRIFLGMIFGGAIGSILGITLAPKSGKETCKVISKKISEFRKKINETLKKDTKKKSKSFFQKIISFLKKSKIFKKK